MVKAVLYSKLPKTFERGFLRVSDNYQLPRLFGPRWEVASVLSFAGQKFKRSLLHKVIVIR